MSAYRSDEDLAYVVERQAAELGRRAEELALLNAVQEGLRAAEIEANALRTRIDTTWQHADIDLVMSLR